jgi:glycerate kinase
MHDPPGAGAAGGTGGALMAFLGGIMRQGFDIVAEAMDLEEAIKMADLVITGEGKLDGQTRRGKTPYGVAKLARKHGKPVIAFAGLVNQDAYALVNEGLFAAIFSIANGPIAMDEAIRRAPELLADAAEQAYRAVSIGK